MSIYGMMQTSISGMNAQSSRLSAVSDNIANSDTVGYKKSQIRFSTLVMDGSSSSGRYTSGGVQAQNQRAVEAEGNLFYTSSSTDLALKGGGFFVVGDGNGEKLLTRAGSFFIDKEGQMTNSEGYILQGYPIDNAGKERTLLSNIVIDKTELAAEPTTKGAFGANLPTSAKEGEEFSYSMVGYDRIGAKREFEVVFTKMAAANPADGTSQWSMSMRPPESFDTPPVPKTVTFDTKTGTLTGPATMDFTLANGEPGTLDFNLTEKPADFIVSKNELNGKPPAAVADVNVSKDGVVTARYDNGTRKDLFRIPIAAVPNTTKLDTVSGTVFRTTNESGNFTLGAAGSGSAGDVISRALEQSNVDIAGELTDMIQSQRNFTANSKVFQTGSDIMDVVVNLKR